MRGLWLIWVALVVNAPPAEAMAKEVKLGEIGVTLRLPDGWQGVWFDGGGQRVYRVMPAGAEQGQAMLNVGIYRDTSHEMANWDMEQVVGRLTEEMQQMLTIQAMRSGSLIEWGKMEPPVAADVSGGPAAYMLAEALVESMSGEGGRAGLWIAALRNGDNYCLLHGDYREQYGAQVRNAGMEILRSIRMSAPETPKIGQSGVVGCWRYRTGSSSYGSYDSTIKTLQFTAAGEYRLEVKTAASTPAGMVRNNHAEHGRWRQERGALFFQPAEGDPHSIPVQIQGDALEIGGETYYLCRG